LGRAPTQGPVELAPQPQVTPVETVEAAASPPPGEEAVSPPSRVARSRPQPAVPTVAPHVEVQPPAPPEPTELQRVDEAFAAMRAGDPQRALTLTEDLERAHPNGAFAEERDAIGIEACVQLHRAEEATKRAERFFAAWPRSTHRRRIEALLAGLDGR
jgi:hypothetical protein